MTPAIRTYQVIDSDIPRRWSLEAFIGYCGTMSSGPAPEANPGNAVSYYWQSIAIGHHQVLNLGTGSMAYFTDGQGLDPTAMQCAVVLQSQSQLLLAFTELGLLTIERATELVTQLGGPSPLLLCIVVTSAGPGNDLTFALQNAAQAIAGKDQPAATGNVAGVIGFTGFPCGITPGGLFGRYVATPSGP